MAQNGGFPIWPLASRMILGNTISKIIIIIHNIRQPVSNPALKVPCSEAVEAKAPINQIIHVDANNVQFFIE